MIRALIRSLNRRGSQSDYPQQCAVSNTSAMRPSVIAAV